MADTTATQSKNGFTISFNCPACAYTINSIYYWNSFFAISKPYDIAHGICPFCKQSFTIDITGIERPFKDSGYLLIKQY